MKKLLILLICITAICLTMSACKPDTKMLPLEKLPSDYSVEQAKADGCFINTDGEISHGADIWFDFVEQTKNGNSASVRFGNLYTLGSPENYDAAYYESVKNEYPKFYVHDLTYDGENYCIRWFEEDKEIKREYKYLMKYQDKPESPYAEYDYYEKYVLTNDNTVSWDDIFHGMVSSAYGQYIDHYVVYTKYY